MRAIRTRYLGPTDHHGARISACIDGARGKVFPFDPGMSDEENHDSAAALFAESLGMLMPERYTLRRGWFGNDCYHVLVPNRGKP